MRRNKHIALALRIISLVLIVATVVVEICSLSTTGTLWGKMETRLKNSGASLNLGDRFRFSQSYYSAMRQMLSEKNADTARKKEVTANAFAWCVDMATEAETVRRHGTVGSAISLFSEGSDFNAAAWMNRFEQTETRLNEKRVAECFTYFDSAALNPPKKGAKGKTLNASNRPAFETYYADLTAAHGEEAGTFLEFCESVQAMLKAHVAANGVVTPAEYLKTIEYADYQAALEAVRAEDRAEEAENLLDAFAVYAARQAKGEKVDYTPFFEEAYEAAKAENPAVAEYEFFVPALADCLQNASFYGDIADVIKAAESKKSAALGSAFAKTVSTWHSDFVAEYNNSVNGFSGIYWLLAQHTWLMMIAAVLMLIASIVMDKLRIRKQIADYKSAEMDIPEDVLLRVDHLCQYFRGVKAVDDVSFDIKKGEVFGLVGESGCGKTTTGRSIIKLYNITSGNIYFKGKRIAAGTKSYRDEIAAKRALMKNASAAEKKQLKAEIHQLKEDMASARFDHDYCDKTHAHDLENEVDERYAPLLAAASGEELNKLKAKYREEKRIARHQRYITQIQMIFQDPVASLDPRMTVREIIAEGLRIRGEKNQEEIDKKVYDVLETVGLVREHAGRYPHEFSGGQKQRIGVARAVVMRPEMIIADEPVSALDVSIQAQVINLLNELREQLGLTIMFIAHDLSVVKYFSDRIGVMYYGKMVELASSDELFAHPLHPYTESLLSAIPLPDPVYEKQRVRIKYDPHVAHDYSTEQPTLREVAPGHFVRCNQAEFERYQARLNSEKK